MKKDYYIRKVQQVNKSVSLSLIISSVIKLETLKPSLPFNIIHQPMNFISTKCLKISDPLNY
jgi:hypothetical protein